MEKASNKESYRNRSTNNNYNNNHINNNYMRTNISLDEIIQKKKNIIAFIDYYLDAQ